MPKFSHADLHHRFEYDEPFSTEDIIESAFLHFRKAGFPYRRLPRHVCMQQVNELARTRRPQALLHSTAAYQVADTYHPHRFRGHAEGKISPYAAFMDDRRLRRAIKLAIEGGGRVDEDYFGTLSLVLGTQACSNFRPGFAAYLYRRFCKPHSVVLDTSTGYGGRLIGAIASRVVHRYIGIDPNEDTFRGNEAMACDLGWEVEVEDGDDENYHVWLLCKPAEEVTLDDIGEQVDFAFTSPPYFAKEHYVMTDGFEHPNQSRMRYNTGEAWLEGFLLPTVQLQYDALKDGCHAIINIADVNYKGKRYPLSQWTRWAAKKVGFKFVERMDFEMSTRYGANQEAEVAVEPVLVFRKE